MQTDNFTPFPYFAFTHAGMGFAFETYVVRADYKIVGDGTLMLSDEQSGPRLTDEYFGDPKCSSLKFEHDRVPLKPFGEACFVSPVSRPPRSGMKRWPVEIKIGAIRMSFIATGKREFRKTLLGGWRLTDPEIGREVPINFESTYGGAHPSDPKRVFEENPVGVGFGLEYLDSSVNVCRGPQIETKNGVVPERPIAITPVHRGWLPRRGLAGTFDDNWHKKRLPFYPVDFDPRFFLQSPESLWLNRGYFKGDEDVEFVNLGRTSSISLKLPESRRLLLRVATAEEKHYQSEMQLDTIVFDLEEAMVSLIWRTSFEHPRPPVRAAIFFGDSLS